MVSRLSRGVLVCVAAVLLAALLASAAEAAVVKNKSTGETLTGAMTKQKVNGLTLFVLENGEKKFLNLSEWEVVEADPEPAPAEKQPAVAPKVATPAPAKQIVYVIPISGAIESTALARAIDKALAEAKMKKASVVVFHMDTPGGRVDVGDKIIDLIQNVTWAKTVAWVQGDSQWKGALSCGAWISLATEAIYMAPGTSIGAAVPYQRHSTGTVEVDEKFQSYFRSKFRALAQKRGHPVALADAMVDTSPGVVQVFVEDKQQMVSKDESERLAGEHKDDGKFKRGKLVVDKGKICCLTAEEALEYGLCKGLCKDQDELAKALGLTSPSFVEARVEGKPLTEWVTKSAEDAKKRFDKAKNVFVANIRQAMNSDPARMLFPDQRGGSKWRELTLRCKEYLQNCAAALKEMEKMANDPNGDYPVSKEMIDELKSELSAMWERLNSQ